MGDAYLRVHPNPHLRQYRSPRREEPSGVVVVHTAESQPDALGPDAGAEAVAGFISRRTDPGSYHELVDSDSFITLVRWEDEAWHDATGSNRHSWGLSMATEAAWWPLAPKAWRDAVVEMAAQRAAAYARWLHARSGIVIPARRITREESERRVPGFISHAERDPARRTDPGSGFPWKQFLARFAELTADLQGGHPTPPPTDEEFQMDAEAKAAFAKLEGEVEALRLEVDAVRQTTLIGVDEGRKQYGSLRGWLAALAEAAAEKVLGTTYAKLRVRAGELDTYQHPGAGT